MTEESLQIAVANLLNHTSLLWMHPPNGGLRNKIVAAKLKRMGVKAGVPDILIFTPSVDVAGVAIELKVDKNRTTDKQQEWIESLTICGWACYVCRSIYEVMAVLQAYYPRYL